jgi:hypothetical protein
MAKGVFANWPADAKVHLAITDAIQPTSSQQRCHH